MPEQPASNQAYLGDVVEGMTVIAGAFLVKVIPTATSQFREERPYTPHNLGVVLKCGDSYDLPPLSQIGAGSIVAYSETDVVELDGYGLPLAIVPAKSICAYQPKTEEQ